jgi:pilus assembly protein FimV
MHTKQPWLSLTIGSITAVAAATAWAAGLGAGGSSAVLGQPLDFPVQVRLEAGETLGPECVAAEVRTGDRRLPPSAVRTQVQSTGPDTARVRVMTTGSIDEPVIEILLAVGCTTRISRQYVVLADPPSTTAPSLAPAFAASPAPAAEPAALPVSTTVPVPGSGSPRAANTDSSTSAGASGPGAAERRPVARAAPLDPQAAQRRAQRRAERRAALAARQAQKPTQVQAGKPAPSGAPNARLQLDFIEPPAPTATAVEAAMQAVAQAASAAQVAAAAASASAERIGVLERTVEQLRGDAKSSRDLAAQFKQRLVENESAGNWVMPLAAMAALLAGLAAWLAWRLGKAQSHQQSGWREAVAPPASPITEIIPSRHPTAPVPFITSTPRQATPSAGAAVRGGARAAPAWPPPAPPVAWPPPDSTLSPETQTLDTEPEPAMQKTEPMPPLASSQEDAPRDVSIEELIDLEQQAEFFVVLGQDEAAVDLLVEHLRSTGGGSPLPYLKLLEIHHRLNQREAYERMRTRFNHRFNAYAPEWGVDLGEGRSLDDYAGVIPRLQQVWPRPLDAMAELEALLFRKSRGELFDLPAYREVLFLYSLARDLLDRASAGSSSVDLLIPMADGGDFSSTAPSPYLGLERDAFRDTQVPDDRPTAPVDFDVSSMERPTSIFDLLDDKPHLPGSPARGTRQG